VLAARFPQPVVTSGATEDEIYERWIEWLGTIAKETIGLFGFRDYWRGLAEMTQANPEIPPRVAHFDERELAAVPTYAEINDALDFIGELINKYESLLKAAQWGTLVPVLQADWTQAFTVAWKRNWGPRAPRGGLPGRRAVHGSGCGSCTPAARRARERPRARGRGSGQRPRLPETAYTHSWCGRSSTRLGFSLPGWQSATSSPAP
jgi:hypothetical protein